MATAMSNQQEKETKHWSGGQIIVAMSIAIVALLGCVGLATDVGVLYFNWMLLQKAADAAVLGGADYLPNNPSTAVSEADKLANDNGVSSSEIVSTEVSSDDMSISMQLKRSVPYYFARVLGLTDGEVSASATASLETVSSVNSIVPIGIDSSTNYTYGQQITLMAGQYGPGNWGPIDLNSSGASGFEYNLEYGWTGQVSAGSWFPTETGLMTGPTQTAFNARLTAGETEDPSGTFENHTLSDPRVVTVPMVDYADINGKSEVPVEGFAELWLVGMDSHQNITAYFIQQVADGEPGGQATNYGAWQPVLTR